MCKFIFFWFKRCNPKNHSLNIYHKEYYVLGILYIYIASCILYLYYIHPAHVSVITTFSHDPRKIRQKALINSIKSLSIQVNLPTQVCKHRSERFLAWILRFRYIMDQLWEFSDVLFPVARSTEPFYRTTSPLAI